MSIDGIWWLYVPVISLCIAVARAILVLGSAFIRRGKTSLC